MTLSVIDAAREAPGRAALVIDGGIADYAALAVGVRRAARFALGHGASPDRPMAFVATSERPTLELLYALVALGVPALLVHPRLVEAERARLVGGATLVEPDHARLEPLPDSVFPARIDAERPLAILHTSGTTGQPKRVVLSRRAFIASAAASAANLGWQDDDRWLLCLPFAHVGGLSIVTRCLLARRTVVVARGAAPATLALHAARDGVTLMSVVPTVLKRMLDAGIRLSPGVRAILVGGAAASPALLARAADAGWPVLTTYGLTEACSQVTTQRYGTTNRGEQGSGHPMAGVEIRIVDDVIEVRGPTLATGYGGAWLRTGDAGRLDAEGRLHVFGRRTDLIVTGGENVYPAEVEAALERCPGVESACVFGIPDEEWGEVVAAMLAAGRDGPPPVEALENHLARELAPFKRPRRIKWVGALVYSANGKLDRAATSKLTGEG